MIVSQAKKGAVISEYEIIFMGKHDPSVWDEYGTKVL